MKVTNLKVIVTGSIIEVYFYPERVLAYDYQSNKGVNSGVNRIIDQEEDLRNKESSVNRTRSNLKRLINANVYIPNNPFSPVFWTLTFKENIQDLKVANKIFSKFIKRLNYFVGNGTKKTFLKYVVVHEFQERGAVHYHAIFFNLKFIHVNILADIWGQGFIKINKIDCVKNIGSYISKYLGKDLAGGKLDGHKRYFSSRNLKRPIFIKNQQACEEILKNIPKEFLVDSREFQSEYHGKVFYTQFNIGNSGYHAGLIKRVAGPCDND
ncbi:MAG: Rep protein [bacterium]